MYILRSSGVNRVSSSNHILINLSLNLELITVNDLVEVIDSK